MRNEKEVLAFVEKVMRVKVEKNTHRWPPLCMGIFHQPKRPVTRSKKN